MVEVFNKGIEQSFIPNVILLQAVVASVLKFQTGKFAECEEGRYWHDLQLAQHVAHIGDEGRGFARKKQKMAIIAPLSEGGLHD